MHSLKSTHLLMWSSPVLLLVLVFTLTSSARMPAAPTSTTMTSAPRTTTTVADARNSSTPPTTSTTTTIALAHPTETSFDSVTSSTVRSAAPAPSAPAMSGALAGVLESGSRVDVPLLGPGAWTLLTSVSAAAFLNCGSASEPLSGRVVVGPDQSCQLEITSTAVGTPTAWQLVPTR